MAAGTAATDVCLWLGLRTEGVRTQGHAGGSARVRCAVLGPKPAAGTPTRNARCAWRAERRSGARGGTQRILGRVASGDDPAADASAGRRAAKDATVAIVCVEYLDETRAKMKQRTADEYARLFKVYIVPSLGRKPVAQVTLRDVSTLHLAHRAHPYQANRIVQLLKTFFFWAEARGYCAANTNPCRGFSKFPEERQRERFLTVDEVGRLGAALSKAELTGLRPAPSMRSKPSVLPRRRKNIGRNPRTFRSPANPFAVAAIRFLLLTGWREQEALTLQWADVDMERGAATLPNTKTGKSHRPIGAPAIGLLAGLPRLDGSRYVFPGTGGAARPLREIKRVWTAVRHAAGLDDVRLHDLRHTVASFSVASGHSLFLTGKLLGHARAETTQRYAHLADDARKVAADAVSGALEAALRGVSAAKVISLASRQR